MTFSSGNSKLIDFVISVGICYVLFAVYTAFSEGDVLFIIKSALLFVFATVGPFVAIIAFWYAVPGLLIFAGCGYLAIQKTQSRSARLAALVVLILIWLVYGIRCFTLVTGGA